MLTFYQVDLEQRLLLTFYQVEFEERLPNAHFLPSVYEVKIMQNMLKQ